MSDNEGYDRLLVLVGGIAADVKHILVRQDRQDTRIDRHEARMDKAHDSMDARVRKLEAFRWKVAGFAIAVPTGLTVAGILIRELLNG